MTCKHCGQPIEMVVSWYQHVGAFTVCIPNMDNIATPELIEEAA